MSLVSLSDNFLLLVLPHSPVRCSSYCFSNLETHFYLMYSVLVSGSLFSNLRMGNFFLFLSQQNCRRVSKSVTKSDHHIFPSLIIHYPVPLMLSFFSLCLRLLLVSVFPPCLHSLPYFCKYWTSSP